MFITLKDNTNMFNVKKMFQRNNVFPINYNVQHEVME